MSKIKETLLSNLMWTLIVILATSIAGIYMIYKDTLVSLVVDKAPKSVYVIGWLLTFLSASLISCLIIIFFQLNKFRDPYKNYNIDSKTRSAIDKKTQVRYCLSCLGNHKLFPMLQDGNRWYCSNRECRNTYDRGGTLSIS
ncbi:MAG: hypothetical protein KKB77_01425 [Bacteroidetes bacterium]|nr:hypothetical protein [Bacteroidota bacterium]